MGKTSIRLPDWIDKEIIGETENRSKRIEELILKGNNTEESLSMIKKMLDLMSNNIKYTEEILNIHGKKIEDVEKNIQKITRYLSKNTEALETTKKNASKVCSIEEEEENAVSGFLSPVLCCVRDFDRGVGNFPILST